MTHNMTTTIFDGKKDSCTERHSIAVASAYDMDKNKASHPTAFHETAVPIFQSQHCTANEAWYWSKCTHPMQWMTWYKTQAWLLSGRCGSVTVCERHFSKACSGRRKCAVSYCVNGNHSRQEKYQARNKQDKEKHFLTR